MRNVLESDFLFESIHKIIKTEYYAKMTSLFRVKYFGEFDRDKE